MKKKLWHFVVLLTFAHLTVYGQVTFPPVAPAKINRGEVKGSYVPRDMFLSQFPDFSKDGKYQFSYKSFVSGFDQVEYEGPESFSNDVYPADMVETNNSLAGLGKLNVQFSAGRIGKLYLDKDNYIYTAIYLKHPELSKLDKNANTSYEQFNAAYKKSVTDIFNAKKADAVNVLDAGVLEIPVSVAGDGLILQFKYQQSNIWVSGKTAKYFPSHALYTLTVKTADGTEVKNYGQAIFFEGSHNNYHYDVIRNTLTNITFPIAVKSLVNRFLNDYDYFKVVADKQNAETLKFNTANVIDFKRRSNAINSQKDDVIANLSSIGISYDFNSSKTDMAGNAIADNVAMYNNGASALSGFLISAIYKAKAKKEQDRLNKLLLVFKQQLEDVADKENKLSAEMKAANLNPEELAYVGEQNKKADLEHLYADMVQKRDAVKGNISTTFSNASNSALNSFTNSINYAVETQKISSAGSGPAQGSANVSPNTSDACSQKCTADWKNSAEYKNYQSVKTNANASDSKAKLIELTIENCGKYRPANEAAALRQTAAKERALAKDLRLSTPNIKL
jgi:hypothetical protein